MAARQPGKPCLAGKFCRRVHAGPGKTCRKSRPDAPFSSGTARALGPDIMKLFALSTVLTISACATSMDPTTSVTGQALSQRSCPAGVPAALAPAVDQDLAFALDAVGTQNYRCAATATGYGWVFVAPEAQLFRRDDDREAVVHHFVGPTWQSLDDGSSVVGAKVAGATVDTTAIPWLLLKAVSHGTPTGDGDLDGDDSAGLMTPVTSIQRLSTQGGLAPAATSCDATTVGATAAVPYTATYMFYRTRPNRADNVRCGS
jgi:hypothetical protein